MGDWADARVDSGGHTIPYRFPVDGGQCRRFSTGMHDGSSCRLIRHPVSTIAERRVFDNVKIRYISDMPQFWGGKFPRVASGLGLGIDMGHRGLFKSTGALGP